MLNINQASAPVLSEYEREVNATRTAVLQHTGSAIAQLNELLNLAPYPGIEEDVELLASVSRHVTRFTPFYSVTKGRA